MPVDQQYYMNTIGFTTVIGTDNRSDLFQISNNDKQAEVTAEPGIADGSFMAQAYF